MSVKIKELHGDPGFFKVGDEIESIDGKTIRDQLDIFFVTAAEGSALFVIRRSNGKTVSRRLRFETLEKAMPVYEEMGFQNCKSRCVFCFVDQMPPGMRSSLYKKDDDYRWSFLYGNYVTLNDVSNEDLDRIVEYNLSPLYISVHATQRHIRNKLFGRPMKRDILSDLRFLTGKGIEINAQIVLVPGLNDGKVLDRTVRDLRSLYPLCRSLAVVPVGITGFREGLENISRVTTRQAREITSWADGVLNSYSRDEGEADFLQLSDEFYLLAGRKLPSLERYGELDQLSNGVGMCRLFLDDLSFEIEGMAGGSTEGLSMTIVTGKSGARFFRQYVTPMLTERLAGASFEVVEVANRTFGGKVTVSGLLSGEDIIAALGPGKGSSRCCVVLPTNCVNHDGLLIDGMTPRDIERSCGVKVFVPENNFLEKKLIRKCMREAGG